jgi:hypothetical protein
MMFTRTCLKEFIFFFISDGSVLGAVYGIWLYKDFREQEAYVNEQYFS